MSKQLSSGAAFGGGGGAEVDRLVAGLIDGLLTTEEADRLDRLLADSPAAVKRYRELLDNHQALCAIYPGDTFESLNAASLPSYEDTTVTRPAVASRWKIAALAACLASAIAIVVLSFPAPLLTHDNQSVATVTELSGPHVWTGDRGEIVRKIEVGTQLSGGTIEGMAPDSWFELQFNDGSTVVIAGISMLTFSDEGQKILRLREGQLTADVRPQPRGRPMLLQTRTATMEVVGTKFDVQAALSSTVLNVSEGKVRLRRLSDGREVDVPAEHLAIADGESQLAAERLSGSVHEWTSDIDTQSDYYGKWKPATDTRRASVKAIPMVPDEHPQVTLHLAGMSVGRRDGSPVVIQPGSHFVVRGRLENDSRVYFGIRVHYPDGRFAGMFRGDLQARQPTTERDATGRFVEHYALDQFTVDPAVRDRRDELAARPDRLVLDGVWVFTHSSPPSGLEVTEVKLLPPAPAQVPAGSKSAMAEG